MSGSATTVGIGASPPRREDHRLVHGTGAYTADLAGPGALHCAFLRSSVAHGRLGAVTVDDAQEAEGVAAVFTAADLDLPDIPASSEGSPVEPAMTRPLLARDSVRHVGEPLALVVAETPYLAADAVELAWADIEPDPVVADARAALRGDVLVFSEAGTNVVARRREPDEWVARTEPDEVVGRVVTHNQRLAPVPIEPLAIVAEPDGANGLTVWVGHQAPHTFRGQLSSLLGLDEARIRVIVPEVGGAFGMKRLYPEYVVVAAAALRLGRRLSWVQTRSEQFLSGAHGRGQHHTVELVGDRSGRIREARIDLLAEVGAYPHSGAQVPWFTRLMATGTYAIPELRITTTIVVTNLAPTMPYRGAGRPEAAYAIERAIDAFARAAGLDPVEVRRRNFIRPEAMPYRTPTGALYDGGQYERAMDMALELADAEGVRREQARRRSTAERKLLGLGVAAFVERAGGAPDSTEYARVELGANGWPVVRVGTAATGQGHHTVWSSLAAEVFGLALDQVTVYSGDTAEVADGVGSFASRSAQLAGSAVVRTATVVRQRAAEVASGLLEVAPSDLVCAQGVFHVLGDPTTGVSLAAVAARARAQGVDLAAQEHYSAHAQTFPYGVYAAVVEVDTDTGRVDLLHLAAVDDCGTVLHPQIVEGQLHGSMMQGVAQALYEGVHYDADGQLQTSTLIDYTLPTAMEMPALREGRLTTPAPSNPLGAKGAGESGCIGAPPAIVNAALDALVPLGVTDLQMPLTPEAVWRAIQEAPHG